MNKCIPLNLMERNTKKPLSIRKSGGNSLIGELTLKGHETILDLGCGDDRLTEQLSQLVPN